MGVKISELNEATSAQNSDVLPIVQNGETKKIQVETLGNQKVNKTGDTLTGELNFLNTNDYAAIRKTRTINETDYQLTIGLGGNASSRIELVGANNTVIGSVEVRDDGIYNGKTGSKLVEETEKNLTVISNLTSGSVTAKQIGKMIIVNINGNMNIPNTWTAYTLAKITGILAKDDFSAPIVDQNTGLCADVTIPANTNTISVNKRGASNITGSWLRAQLVFISK